jgi:hypothetical protein
MVHALQEAWRVLVPRGLLIDLRPISVDVPLEIITPAGYESAGLLDLSPGIKYDIAADDALQVILRDESFKELQVENFDSAYYWNTIPEMKAYMDDKWKDDLIIPDAVLQQAQLLFDRHLDQGRVRLRLRMKLGEFEKHFSKFEKRWNSKIG